MKARNQSTGWSLYTFAESLEIRDRVNEFFLFVRKLYGHTGVCQRYRFGRKSRSNFRGKSESAAVGDGSVGDATAFVFTSNSEIADEKVGKEFARRVHRNVERPPRRLNIFDNYLPRACSRET